MNGLWTSRKLRTDGCTLRHGKDHGAFLTSKVCVRVSFLLLFVTVRLQLL